MGWGWEGRSSWYSLPHWITSPLNHWLLRQNSANKHILSLICGQFIYRHINMFGCGCSRGLVEDLIESCSTGRAFNRDIEAAVLISHWDFFYVQWRQSCCAMLEFYMSCQIALSSVFTAALVTIKSKVLIINYLV